MKELVRFPLFIFIAQLILQKYLISPNIEAMVNEKLHSIMQDFNEEIKNRMEVTMKKFQSENNIKYD